MADGRERVMAIHSSSMIMMHSPFKSGSLRPAANRRWGSPPPGPTLVEEACVHLSGRQMNTPAGPDPPSKPPNVAVSRGRVEGRGLGGYPRDAPAQVAFPRLAGAVKARSPTGRLSGGGCRLGRRGTTQGSGQGSTRRSRPFLSKGAGPCSHAVIHARQELG